MAEQIGVDVGDSAPDVTGQLVRPDGEVEDVSLSTLAAEKPVLLSFYTADFSPDCIEEWCSFRDFDWFSTGEQVQVVGVSKSGARTHKQFIKRLNLGFPLYTDGNLAIAEAFGVAYRAFGLSRRSRRSCFLLDESMTVRYKWVGEHWLDPTRDTPPVGEIHDAIQAELGDGGAETFGF
ncbi:peroxiredoxin [Haloprofundus marisrubri]|uniref:thioredoxin-dependent peroxiredoxin n=1 Tax=Haloprofundus marisrubri TaxID=1514971 RepID=A0A0W1RC41_9EURY|nr:redoxin domain-containing protein [Haloprofundus marisrubri]KTG10961.1 peroxiredoxin [Haloprofundus marisrubri]